MMNAFDHAKEAGLTYTFKSVGSASIYHPNTVKLLLTKGERTVEVIGESLGGGVINIAKVDGFTANFSSSLHTLIVRAEDKSGSIAFIASILANEQVNIATMTVSRKGKKDLACQFIEMDEEIRPLTRDYLKSLHWVKEVIYIPVIQR